MLPPGDLLARLRVLVHLRVWWILTKQTRILPPPPLGPRVHFISPSRCPNSETKRLLPWRKRDAGAYSRKESVSQKVNLFLYFFFALKPGIVYTGTFIKPGIVYTGTFWTDATQLLRYFGDCVKCQFEHSYTALPFGEPRPNPTPLHHHLTRAEVEPTPTRG